MGLSHSPRTVTDGLVFYMDQGNTYKSWKGKPTTNLVASPYSLLTGFVKAAGVTVTDNVARNIDGTQNVGLITGSGWLAYVGATTTNGQQYTTSWIIKKDSVSVTVLFDWGGSHQGNRTNFTFNLLTGAFTGVTQAAGEIYGVREMGNFWVVYYSSTLTTGNAYYPQISVSTGVNVYFGGIQIETGNVASPLVTGTRSNTQALLDLTGRNTITASSLTYAANGSFSFNGSADYLILQDLAIPIQNTSYTIEAWIKRSTAGVAHGIIGDLQYDWQTFHINATNNLVSQHRRLSDNAVNTVTSVGTISTSRTHVAVVFDITAGKRLYINGVLDNTNSSTTEFQYISANRGPKYIGISNPGAFNTSARLFNGNIDVVKGYTRALTAEEIQQNFNALRGRYGI